MSVNTLSNSDSSVSAANVWMIEPVWAFEVRTPCRSHDPDLWFAEDLPTVERAQSLCRICPLQQECLLGAIARREPWGVWGGEVFEQGQVVAPPPTRSVPELIEELREGEDRRPAVPAVRPDLAAPHSGHAERLSDSGQQAGSLVAALLTQAGEAIAVAQHRHAKPRHRTVERQYRTHPVSLGWRSKKQLGIVPE